MPENTKPMPRKSAKPTKQKKEKDLSQALRQNLRRRKAPASAHTENASVSE